MMNPPAPTVDLSSLDNDRPVTLDPRVWQSNLDALAAEQPGFADALRVVSLPESWRPALALDDFVTHRIEKPGQPAAWLGGTAAPVTRAAALLEQFVPAGNNLALPVIAAGAELRFLLERLPRHMAVFVFETDLMALAAVLRIQDFSTAIAEGRCVLVPPGREIASLSKLMGIQPGLLPPGSILLPDLVPAARIDQIRTVCEQVHAETDRRRSARLAELVAAPRADSASPAAQPRLAILALTPHSATRAVAADVERAARGLGWEVMYRCVAGPRGVHPLVHCEALAEFRPSLTLCMNHLGSLLPVVPSGVMCTWFHSVAAVPAELPDDGTLYLAASPAVADALRRAGAGPDAVLDWYWACVESAQSPEDASAAGNTVILVGDLPDHRPEIHGVKQGTHERLWEQLRVTAGQAWDTPRILRPDRLLDQAQRECGVALTEASLLETMVQLVERAIVPAAVLERLARALAGEAVEVLALGRGWERLSGPGIRPLAADLFDLPDRGADLRPLACVIAAGGDVLSPTLLHAASMGWPLLVHNLGGQSLVPALGDVLQPERHFDLFADLAGLRRALRSLREAPPAVLRRAERARRHVHEHHSYRRRLLELVAFLSERSAHRR